MQKTKLIRWQSVLALLAVLSLLSLPLAAQNATGRVVGVVTDPSGSVVPRAKVTVTNADTGVSNDTTSEDDGSYQVLLLPIGSYKVSAEAKGFRKTVTAAQRLEINQSLKVDVKLEVGSTAEVVQVEANASGVETVNATIANSVTGTQISEAPLNGRNVMDLATMLPGVIPAVAGGTQAAFSVAGGRGDSVTYLLDGGVNNDLLSNGLVYNPNPDNVEEFRILTSNYTAEYGRSGGGIVSVVTKSGTNEFHGSVFEYVRNNYFNANTFFNNEQNLPISILKRNQFGARIGGPIAIPKLFNGRNRAFFSIGYQGQRLSQLSSATATAVFTPAEMKGDFSRSNSSGTGPDPSVVAYLQQFPFFQPNPTLASQGIIDPTKVNPVAQAYIKANLIPNTPSGTLFFQGAATNNNDELTEKLDFVVTEKDRLSVTLGSYRNPQLTPGNPGYPYTNGFNRYVGTVTYTKTISPTMLNELRFTAQRNNIKQAFPAASLPKAAELGVGITPDDPTGPPRLGFNSGLTTGFSPQGPTSEIDNTYVWSDSLTWTKGKHGLKTGFSYTPFQNNTVYDFYVNGEFDFYGTGGTSFLDNDHAAFMMGLPDELYQAPRAPSNIRTHNIAWYLQDEWKVRKNLTITLGLRYEYSSPKLDLQGRSFSLAIGQQSTVFTNAPKGLLFPGDAQAPAGSNYPDRNDWGPRVGFAWDPKGDGKMSIRGGVGVFYDILKGEDNLQFNGQPPFFAGADLFFNALDTNPTGPVNYMSAPFVAVGTPNPFPSKPPPKNINFADAGYLPVGGGGLYYVNTHLRTPYIYQYNLSVQRELMRGMTLEVSYIGSDSHKLTGLTDANPYPIGSKTRIFNAVPGVAAGSFSYLEEFNNVGQANYNSMAMGLSKRFSDSKIGAFQYQLSYTYGHSIDNASGFRSRDSSVPAYNWDQFKGSSDFDLRHYIAFSGSWELPFAKAWSSGPRRLVKGWTLYPIVTYRTGAPLDVFAGLSASGTKPGPSGVGDQQLVRANLVAPIVYYDPHADQTNSVTGRTGNFFFNPTSFQAPATVTGVYTYGTLGRNVLRGPDLVNTNITLAKITDIYKDRAKLEIRADFFNVFNHAEFSNPTTSINSKFFGQITATGDPRIIQLAARFTF